MPDVRALAGSGYQETSQEARSHQLDRFSHRKVWRPLIDQCLQVRYVVPPPQLFLDTGQQRMCDVSACEHLQLRLDLVVNDHAPLAIHVATARSIYRAQIQLERGAASGALAR